MSTEAQTLDTRDLERRVKEMYREVAEQPFKGFHFETGRMLAERLGYSRAELDAIPAEAIDSFAGVGHYFDLARIQPGEVVLDLGSGAGTDSFLAARQVGEKGRVIGIDMTDAQLTKARRLAADHSFSNVEFVEAHIEEVPLADRSADIVISNGVINLAPDKARVFAEARRVLRPGGRLALADIVTSTQLPVSVTCDASLWAACIGGAMQRDDYRDAIESAGFEIEDLKENDQYQFVSERAENATSKYGVKSVSLLAFKRPSEALERGRDALSRGGWEEARAAFGDALERSDSAEAWEGLSWAASWLEDGAGAIEARERACRLYQEAGDLRGAARMAIWLGDAYIDFRGEEAGT